MLRFASIAAGVLLMSIPATSPAEVHEVQAEGFSFTPSDLSITVGDTVKWVNISGFHTVTEGTSPADTIPPPDFDALLTPSIPEFTFTFNTVGNVPYYCRPHFSIGMTGIIRVMAPTSAPSIESRDWGRIKDLYR